MEELLKDESIDLEGDNEIVDREQERREREDKMLELKKKAERVSFFSYTPPSLLQTSVHAFSALPFAHLHPRSCHVTLPFPSVPSSLLLFSPVTR